MPRPTRQSVDENAAAYRAALLGEPCPPDFNPFIYLDFESALHGFPCKQTEAMRELWKLERTQLVATWRRRRHKGLPPGAYFDKGKSR